MDNFQHFLVEQDYFSFIVLLKLLLTAIFPFPTVVNCSPWCVVNV